MARLDQLIDALVKHSAESLVLTEGAKPALIIDGSSRPIVKTAVDISQMRQLAAEVTPSHLQDEVLAGNELNFIYGGASMPMRVEIKATEVILRPLDAAAAEPAPPPAETAAPSVAEPPTPSAFSEPPLSAVESAAPEPMPVPAHDFAEGHAEPEPVHWRPRLGR